jgi:hypothetical protein
MNTSFLSLTRQALLIWLSTNAIASAIYSLYMFAAGALEPLSSISSTDTLLAVALVGLVFSSPVILFLIPAIHVLNMLRRKRQKVVYIIGITLFLCLGVILFFFRFFGIPDREKLQVIVFLLPYIAAAGISFFLVTRKLIMKDLVAITDNSTVHSEKI